MKSTYRKIKYTKWRFDYREESDYRYELISGDWFRRVRTFNEIRQNYHDRVDDDLRDLNCRPRASRSKRRLDAWNDFRISRQWGRSWKDYTRHRTQWGVKLVSPPVEER